MSSCIGECVTASTTAEGHSVQVAESPGATKEPVQIVLPTTAVGVHHNRVGSDPTVVGALVGETRAVVRRVTWSLSGCSSEGDASWQDSPVKACPDLPIKACVKPGSIEMCAQCGGSKKVDGFVSYCCVFYNAEQNTATNTKPECTCDSLCVPGCVLLCCGWVWLGLCCFCGEAVPGRRIQCDRCKGSGLVIMGSTGKFLPHRAEPPAVAEAVTMERA